MRSRATLAWFLSLALVAGLPGLAGAQTRARIPRPHTARVQKPPRPVTLDLSTGTLQRGPATREALGASTIASFSNLDLSGFTAVDTGGGASEWFDAAVKTGGASERMTGFTTAYCSAALDPELGGPGGSIELSFWEGYTLGGLGGAPNGEEVTRVCLTGLPAHTTSSSFFGGYSCYFLKVTFGAPVCFPDGPLGYSWKFTDIGTDGTLGATFPLLACVQSCSGAGPDGLGMSNALDQYSPPGSLASTFSFGGGFFTSMAMEIHEELPAALLTAAPKVKGEVETHITGNEGEKTRLDSKALVEALHAKLGNNGFHSLIFSMSCCHGGAFLDDLQSKFKGATKPVWGSSACTKVQEAPRIDPDPDNPKNAKVNAWAFSYSSKGAHPGIDDGNNKNPKESDAFTKAKEAPLWKEASKGSEATPQSVSIAQGGNVKLGGGAGGSGATKFKAILFTGSQEPSHWNNMGYMYRMLRRSGYGAGDILVLDFNGVDKAENAVVPKNEFKDSTFEAATRKKMLDAIAAWNVDADTQVFLYIGGHGTVVACQEKKQVPRRQNRRCQNTFDLGAPSALELEILASPGNVTGPFVELLASRFSCGPLPSGYEVYFNDTFLGSIPGGGELQELQFPLDPELIRPEGNEIWLANLGTTEGPIVVDVSLCMGLLLEELVDVDPLTPRGGLTPGGWTR